MRERERPARGCWRRILKRGERGGEGRWGSWEPHEELRRAERPTQSSLSRAHETSSLSSQEATEVESLFEFDEKTYQKWTSLGCTYGRGTKDTCILENNSCVPRCWEENSTAEVGKSGRMLLSQRRGKRIHYTMFTRIFFFLREISQKSPELLGFSRELVSFSFWIFFFF